MAQSRAWPIAGLTPRLTQSLLVGGALLVTFAAMRGRGASDADARALIVSAGVLMLLPAAFSAAAFLRRCLPERTLIVGTSQMARKLVAELAVRRNRRHHIVGIVADECDALEQPYRDLVCGPVNELGGMIDQLRPDRIVVALADRRGRLPMRDLLDARMRGVQVEDGVDLYERLTGKLAIESLTPSNLIASRDFRKNHLDLASGHVGSVVAAAAGLVVLAPLLALIALAIRLDSPGSVFFVQDRVGQRGKRFKLIKFRTMRPADGVTSEWARDNHARITRLGGWLRKFRLDELPQLINVVRGEMNLVGPRPHPVSNFELFRDNIPYYSLRAVIRPGLTGWAQVRQGYANSLEEETEKMRYDLYYIKHMSAWLDLRILVSTVGTVLWGRESIVRSAARRPPALAAPDGQLMVLGRRDLQPRVEPVLSDRVAAVLKRPAAVTPDERAMRSPVTTI